MGERRKTRGKRWSFKDVGSSFSSVQAADMAGGARDSSMLGACPLILIGPCSGFVKQVVTSHPAPVDGVKHQGAEP